MTLAVPHRGHNLTLMICRFSGLDPCATLVAGLALVWPLAAHAQQQPAPDAATQTLDLLTQSDKDLQAARDAQPRSAETETALKREIEQFGADRRELNQDLIDAAGAGRAPGGGTGRGRRIRSRGSR